MLIYIFLPNHEYIMLNEYKESQIMYFLLVYIIYYKDLCIKIIFLILDLQLVSRNLTDGKYGNVKFQTKERFSITYLIPS